MATPVSNGIPMWGVALIVVIVLLLVFEPVTRFDFVVWDDDLHVYANPHLSPFTWSNLETFWRAPYEYLYIPLTYTVWAAVAWLSQTGQADSMPAEAFHRLNLLLHIGSVLVVYRIGLLLFTRRTLPSMQAVFASGFGALLFGVHPLQVEAVAWVSGLKDVLCGWWTVVALWQYLSFVQSHQKWQQALHYSIATVAFACALLSKPMAVTGPVMAAFLAIGGLSQPWQQACRALSGWLLIALAWGIWTKSQQPDMALSFVAPLWVRPLLALDTMAFYFGKLLWPVGLGPDYGRTPQIVIAQGRGLLTGVVPLGLGMILWCWRTHWPGLLLAGGVFVAGMAPVLGFIPFMFQAYSTVADRYVYLAMVGVALGGGWCIQHYGRRYSVWIAVTLLVCLLAGRSIEQVHIWRDTMSLLTHALRVNPRSAMSHNNLGLTFAKEGRLDAALTSFQTAVQLRPDLPEAHYNLGKILTMQDKFDDAIAHYKTALHYQPGWAEAHNNLGVTLAAQGQHEAALAQYATALLLKSGWVEVYYNMGNIFSQQGRITEAVSAYRAALQGRAVWFSAAINLVQLLTTHFALSPASIREAVELAEQACRATAYQDATALHALAVAYHTAGLSSHAVQTAETALVRARATSNFPLIHQIEALLPAHIQRFSHHEVP
jgi:Tfp pilus assembly protein PilF